MKPLLPFTCLLLALAGMLCADVPRKPGVTKYRSLWTNSPFTTKPIVTSAPSYNPLQDYVLLGVAPIPEGYMVTLLNTKNPKGEDGRFTVRTDQPKMGIEIVDVIHSKSPSQRTQVRLSKAGKTGLVGFEEKYLALKAPPTAPANSRTNPSVQAIRDAAKKSQNTRAPRRRIVPPVPKAPNNQSQQRSNSSNQNRGNTQPNRRGFPGMPNQTR